VALAALFLAQILIVASRTETPAYRAQSEKADRYRDALSATKLAFWQRCSLPQATDGKSGSAPPIPTAAQRANEDEALAGWRHLANAANAQPGDIRRLGIALFLFQRPGGLDAFRRLRAAPQTASPVSEPDRAPGPPLAELLPSPQPLSPNAEVAFWETLYGPKPLPPARVPELRETLARMQLGWFENIAAAQLYRKAGMAQPEREASKRAYAAARQILIVQTVQLSLLFYGLAGWLALGVRTAQRRTQARSRPNPSPEVPARRTEPPFGARDALRAFTAALVVMLIGSIPLGLLRAVMTDGPAIAQLRFSLIAQMLLYAPMLWVALALLRSAPAREAQPPPISPPEKARRTWGQTLEQLRLPAQKPWQELGAGLLRYALVFPLFFGLSWLSTRLFHQFETPQNQALVQILAIQSPFDKALLLLAAAFAAPLVEEIMFRGMLYPALRARWGVYGGAAASAALFAVAHPNLPAGFLPLWLLGFAFALTFEQRETLLPCIVMHGLHNGLTLAAALAILAA
jgi:membrane protease YdiL (CAAX protease family)